MAGWALDRNEKLRRNMTRVKKITRESGLGACVPRHRLNAPIVIVALLFSSSQELSRPKFELSEMLSNFELNNQLLQIFHGNLSDIRDPEG